MSKQLANQHALLTGAGGGIGVAVARAFAMQGARCTLVDIALSPTPDVERLIADFRGAVQYIASDITQTHTINPMVAQAVAAFGPIHTLFNNAAVFDMAPLLESSTLETR